MSRNIVPRVDKGADLGTPLKNWNRLYADAVILRGSDLQALLNGKTDLETLTAKGDIYVATGPGAIARLPVGEDGSILTTNSLKPEGVEWTHGDVRQLLSLPITVTVGSGGQYNTINQAIDSITALYTPKYKPSQYPRVTIRLLPGFIMEEQILIDGLDLSWITITGDDDETRINRSSLTIAFWGAFPAFAVTNGGILPIINQLFYMDTSGSNVVKGIYAVRGSKVIINANCGIKNAGEFGLHTINSTAYAQNTIFSGAGMYGICASSGSMVSAKNANVTNSQYIGIFAETGSIVDAENADTTGAVTRGIAVEHGGIINAYGLSGTISQTENILTSNGIIFK